MSRFILIFYVLNSCYLLREYYLIILPKIFLVNGKIYGIILNGNSIS